jgi:ubiquinone/menaquinone biosynthesis C-methylase UbiE
MKMRESGMPELEYWESLFDAESFFEQLEFPLGIDSVAEFGCGYGTFTLPIAQRINKMAYALDLDNEMLKFTYKRAASLNIFNITIHQCDLLDEGSEMSDESVDGVFIPHILHGEPEDNLGLLREAFRILQRPGKLAVIHWRTDVDTPRGPPMEYRLTAEEAVDLCANCGFDKDSAVVRLLGEYHWGFTISK